MKEKENKYEPVVSFKEQTPEMFLRTEKQKELYEKAFLSAEENCKTEYGANTTTWD